MKSAKELYEEWRLSKMNVTITNQDTFLAGFKARGELDAGIVDDFSMNITHRDCKSTVATIYDRIKALDSAEEK